MNNLNANWFDDPKFDNFWKCYSNVETYKQSNPIYDAYCKEFDSIKQASYLAHYAALDELSKLNTNTHQPVFLKDEENDSVEFEISDEVLDFYESSRKFKNEKKEQEKERLKGLNDGSIKEHIQGEQIDLEALNYSKNAPLERAGLKREEELKLLYGTRANFIHLTETRLQMKYDRNLDLYQPKFWPSFPLKLKFN